MIVFHLTKDKLRPDIDQNYEYFRENLDFTKIENIKVDLLRVLVNMVHINPKATDFILDNEYLVLCLSFTTMDQ